jgi:hypothetical protein
MMLKRMFAEVVSVARPGSSDGGSAPQLTVISCFAAVLPSDEPSSLLPPQAATTMRNATESAIEEIEESDFLGMKCPPLDGADLQPVMSDDGTHVP